MVKEPAIDTVQGALDRHPLLDSAERPDAARVAPTVAAHFSDRARTGRYWPDGRRVMR